jgi:hypothetical protein
MARNRAIRRLGGTPPERVVEPEDVRVYLAGSLRRGSIHTARARCPGVVEGDTIRIPHLGRFEVVASSPVSVRGYPPGTQDLLISCLERTSP